MTNIGFGVVQLNLYLKFADCHFHYECVEVTFIFNPSQNEFSRKLDLHEVLLGQGQPHRTPCLLVQRPRMERHRCKILQIFVENSDVGNEVFTLSVCAHHDNLQKIKIFRVVDFQEELFPMCKDFGCPEKSLPAFLCRPGTAILSFFWIWNPHYFVAH